MADIIEIVELSKLYLDAFDKRNERFILWTTGQVYEIVQETLHKITNQITKENDFFKSNLYVSTGENKINGLSIRSGKLSIPASNEFEGGFEICFTPLFNGKIHVYVFEHSLNDSHPKHHTIAVVDNLSDITEQAVIDYVYTALNIVYKSSLLFAGEE